MVIVLPTNEREAPIISEDTMSLYKMLPYLVRDTLSSPSMLPPFSTLRATEGDFYHQILKPPED